MDPDQRPVDLHLCRISAGLNDRVRLTDPYVEEVWSEFLGPTATLLVRRLARTIEERPAGVQLDIVDVAASLGVSPSVAVRAFERLHRFGVAHADLDRRVVGVSGFAPVVGQERVFRLSEAGRVAHERFVADLDAGSPTVGRATEMLTPPQPLFEPRRGVVPVSIR